MNCKPGDLAIQIKSYAGNEGQIVFIEKYIGAVNFVNLKFTVNDCWHVKYQCKTPDFIGQFSEFGSVPDSWLRPVSGLPDTEDTDIEQPIKEVA